MKPLDELRYLHKSVDTKELERFKDIRNEANVEFCKEAHKMVPRLIEALELAIEHRNELLDSLCPDRPTSGMEEKANQELERILEGK